MSPLLQLATATGPPHSRNIHDDNDANIFLLLFHALIRHIRFPYLSTPLFKKRVKKISVCSDCPPPIQRGEGDNTHFPIFPRRLTNYSIFFLALCRKRGIVDTDFCPPFSVFSRICSVRATKKKILTMNPTFVLIDEKKGVPVRPTYFFSFKKPFSKRRKNYFSSTKKAGGKTLFFPVSEKRKVWQ